MLWPFPNKAKSNNSNNSHLSEGDKNSREWVYPHDTWTQSKRQEYSCNFTRNRAFSKHNKKVSQSRGNPLKETHPKISSNLNSTNWQIYRLKRENLKPLPLYTYKQQRIWRIGWTNGGSSSCNCTIGQIAAPCSYNQHKR